MHKLHIHIMYKFQTQYEKIKKVIIDLLDFKLDVRHSLGSFHDRFMALEANVQELLTS